MSERHVPVGWNLTKVVYDAIVLALVGIYTGVFLWVAPAFQRVTLPSDDYTMKMNAFGTCAFLLLTAILCIGPAARLDPRFLPLLYNRRHLGVITAAVALTHASAALDWYFSYAPVDRWEMLLRGAGRRQSHLQAAQRRHRHGVARRRHRLGLFRPDDPRRRDSVGFAPVATVRSL